MPLTQLQRNRLRDELEEKGITPKAASLNTKWRTGRRMGRSLNETYISQVISSKKRGSLDIIEWVCEDNGLDFDYVKNGPRPPAEKTGKRLVAADVADMQSQLATLRAMRVRSTALLAELIESALRVHGAEPQAAASIAETILRTWQAKLSHD